MNKILSIIILCLASKLLCAQAFGPGSNPQQGRGPIDTNRVVYDETGKVVKYSDYSKLLKTGDYIIKLTGDPLIPGTKAYLTKVTEEDKRIMAEKLKGNGPNTAVLKVGNHLDAMPLAKVLNNDYSGNKILLMVFWHPDCQPCTPRIMELDKYLREIKSDNLVVLLITGADQAYAEEWLKVNPLFNARLVSDPNIVRFYQVTPLPVYVIGDRYRTVRFNTTGLGPTNVVRAKEMLDELLGFGPPNPYVLLNDEQYLTRSKKAFELIKVGKYAEAVEVYNELFSYSNGRGVLVDNYNAACAWAMLADNEKAFHYLELAVSVNKWADLAHISTDTDLHLLHSDKRWQRILEQVKINVAEKK